MDAEIAYAVEAGLDYWAFLWYSLSSANSAMQQAWTFYQSSADKNNINWCLMWSGPDSLALDVANNLSTITAYTQQSNYQKVLTNRPLILIHDNAASRGTLASDVAALRASIVAAGLGTPYIGWDQYKTPKAAELITYGFDATTSYAYGDVSASPTPYWLLDRDIRIRWDTAAAQLVDYIPLGVMGWDRRPMVENPVPWDLPGHGTLSDYHYPQYTTDPAVHLDAMLAWMRANAARTPANVGLIYSWNEFAEGGWICPTLIPGAPGQINRSKVDALARVLV